MTFRFILPLLIVLSACQSITQKNTSLLRNNDIEPVLACGVQCLTLNQGAVNKKVLDDFISSQNPNNALLVAPCKNRQPSPNFIDKILKIIQSRGIRVSMVKPMIPYSFTGNVCLILVRGPVVVHPPKCMTPKRKRGAFIFPESTPLVGDDFGCYSQQNLAFMIDNPRDLVALSGFSGRIE